MEVTVLLATAAGSLFLLVLGALVDELRAWARRRATTAVAAAVAMAVEKREELARRLAAAAPRLPTAAPARLPTAAPARLPTAAPTRLPTGAAPRPEPPRPPAPERELIAASRLALARAPTPVATRPGAPAPAPARPPVLAFARLPVPAPRLSAIITLEHSTITAERRTIPERLPVCAAGSVIPIVQPPPTDPDLGEDTGDFTVVDVRRPEPVSPFTPWPRSSFESATGAPARAPKGTTPPPWSRRRYEVPSWPVAGSPASAESPPPAPSTPPTPSPAVSPSRAGYTGPTRVLRKR